MSEEQVQKKNGPFSSKEIDFLKKNYSKLTPEEMAVKLGRNINTVLSHLSEMDSRGSKADILNLRKRADWNVIKGQLSEEEQDVFEWHWKNIVQQFKEEIHHTEGMQVINAIKHEILANRMMTDQQKVIKSIDELTKKLEEEAENDNPDFKRIDVLEKQIASMCAVQEVNNREYRENSKKLSEILESLKATRKQRREGIEEARTNFTALMKRVLEDPRVKKEWGIEAEKGRLAKYKELERLGELHQYDNGDWDRPILSDTTLSKDKND